VQLQKAQQDPNQVYVLDILCPTSAAVRKERGKEKRAAVRERRSGVSICLGDLPK